MDNRSSVQKECDKIGSEIMPLMVELGEYCLKLKGWTVADEARVHVIFESIRVHAQRGFDIT